MPNVFSSSQANLLVRKSTALLLLASLLSAWVIFPALASRDPVENGPWKSSGETRVTGAEMVDLCCCETLADDLSRSPERRFEDFQRLLTERNLQRIWYAAVVRWRFADGRQEDVTYIRKPFDDPASFLEFRDLLISDRVDSGCGILTSLSPRAVHMVADDQASRAPIAVVLDTLDANDHRD